MEDYFNCYDYGFRPRENPRTKPFFMGYFFNAKSCEYSSNEHSSYFYNADDYGIDHVLAFLEDVFLKAMADDFFKPFLLSCFDYEKSFLIVSPVDSPKVVYWAKGEEAEKQNEDGMLFLENCEKRLNRFPIGKGDDSIRELFKEVFGEEKNIEMLEEVLKVVNEISSQFKPLEEEQGIDIDFFPPAQEAVEKLFKITNFKMRVKEDEEILSEKIFIDNQIAGFYYNPKGKSLYFDNNCSHAMIVKEVDYDFLLRKSLSSTELYAYYAILATVKSSPFFVITDYNKCSEKGKIGWLKQDLSREDFENIIYDFSKEDYGNLNLIKNSYELTTLQDMYLAVFKTELEAPLLKDLVEILKETEEPLEGISFKERQENWCKKEEVLFNRLKEIAQ